MNVEIARRQMIEQQVRAWEVLDERVLGALAQVRRELFTPEAFRELAFADTQIPIGHGQFMLAPKVEGRFLQALELDPADDVLEIGTGSGFFAACLARLGRKCAQRRDLRGPVRVCEGKPACLRRQRSTG